MAYLERELADADRHWMEQHRAGCTHCDTMVRDVDALVADAAALPALSPSRDLWSGIAERLEAPVVPLPTRTAAAMPHTMRAPSTRRGVSVRWFAVAATVLVTVSSAVTWRIARSSADAASIVAANDRAMDSAANAAFVPVVNASDVYEQEIAALRTIVNERFTELDSATVVVLQRNLAIIDKAIADSRKALTTDPNSRVLSSTLDRALETKLALMRRLALL